MAERGTGRGREVARGRRGLERPRLSYADLKNLGSRIRRCRAGSSDFGRRTHSPQPPLPLGRGGWGEPLFEQMHLVATLLVRRDQAADPFGVAVGAEDDVGDRDGVVARLQPAEAQAMLAAVADGAAMAVKRAVPLAAAVAGGTERIE